MHRRVAIRALNRRMMVFVLSSAALNHVHWALGQEPDVSALARAAARAKSKDQLLLVIELAEEFTSPPFSTPSSQVFRTSVLCEPTLKTTLDEQFEVVVRAVAPPQADALQFHPNARPVGHAPILYFCDHEGRVLNFLVGYPAADQLSRAAQWSQRVWTDGKLQPDLEARQKTTGQWHADCVVGSHLAMFREALGNTKSKAPSPPPSSPRAIVAAADKVRLFELKHRFPTQWNDQTAVLFSQLLSEHGEVATDFAHMVMIGSPLARRSELAGPIFRVINGAVYCETSSRHDALRELVARQVRESRGTLFVVAEVAAEDLVNQPLSAATWHPRIRSLQQALSHVSVVEISHGELWRYLADAGAELPSGSDTNAPLQFVLLDETGRPLVAASGTAAEARLATAISKKFANVAVVSKDKPVKKKESPR